MLWLLYASLFHWELVYIQMQKTHKLAMIERVGIILKLQLATLKKKMQKNSTHVSETTNNPSRY